MIDKIINTVKKHYCFDTNNPERLLRAVLNNRTRLAAIWVSCSDDLLRQEFDRRGGCLEKPRIEPPAVTEEKVADFVAAAAQALFPGLSGYSAKCGMFHTTCCGSIEDIVLTFVHESSHYTVYGDDGISHEVDYG